MWVKRPVMMLSSVDMPLNSAMFWKVRAMPWLADRVRPHRPALRARNQISPSCGW